MEDQKQAKQEPKQQEESKKEEEEDMKNMKNIAKQAKQAMKSSKQKKVASYMTQEEQKADIFSNLDLESAIKLKKDITKMPDAYNPQIVERFWHKWWVKQNFFKANPENVLKGLKKPYVMCLPPPNVTGYLHLGHALTVAIEDSIIRRKRMQGFECLYLPGQDHAGIATHTVVEKHLQKTENISRHQIGREKFVSKVWEWKEKHGNVIFEQLERLTASLDNSRYHFTMDDQLSIAVKEAFVRFHEMGLIYRANRLVNWSCKLHTAISDIECVVETFDKPKKIQVPGHDSWYEFGVLHHFCYQLKEDPTKTIEVATTRLETMLGDTAVAVNSKDPRYKDMVGKELIHPFIPDRKLKIITDDILVDMSFGTGAVKITPAHDQNDYLCGQRHGLEFINIFNDDGTINENGGPYKGKKRFDVRNQLLEDLKKLGLLRGKTPNPMNIAFCQRSKDVVEPLLRPQWYVKFDEISKEMLKVVEQKQLTIIPEEFESVWRSWLENPRDWCISRQLWWGHRIPAYIVKIKGKPEPDTRNDENWVVGRDAEEAMKKAVEKFKVPKEDITLVQDEDVLDTWFSSGLFPFSTMGWPNEKNLDFKAFFPNQILETGHDILFFWVARMVMMSLLLTKQLPFTHVYLHPIIRDADGKKMSKSLGNVVDPLEIIDGCPLQQLIDKLDQGNLDPKELNRAKTLKLKEYPEGFPQCGSDAVRFGLLSYMMQGRFINFDIKRIISYREFCNKIWQTIRFGLLMFPANFKYIENQYKYSEMHFINQWILTKLNKVIKEVNDHFDKYFFGDATICFQVFWKYDLCDNYLEAIKPILSGNDENLKQQTLNTLLKCLESGLRLLHPMMPFISEELYQKIPDFQNKFSSLPISEYPKVNPEFENEKIENEFEVINKIAQGIRSMRASVNLPNKNLPTCYLIVENEDNVKKIVTDHQFVLCTLSRAKQVILASNPSEIPDGCLNQAVTGSQKLYVQVKEFIKIEDEIKRLEKKISDLNKLIENQQKKMSIKNYETKVPEEIKKTNKEKIDQYKQEMIVLEDALNNMKAIKQ